MGLGDSRSVGDEAVQCYRRLDILAMCRLRFNLCGKFQVGEYIRTMCLLLTLQVSKFKQGQYEACTLC